MNLINPDYQSLIISDISTKMFIQYLLKNYNQAKNFSYEILLINKNHSKDLRYVYRSI